MTDLTVVPVTAEMTILDRSHGEFMWDNSGSISGGLCILRWGLSGRQDSYMHNDPFPADEVSRVQRFIRRSCLSAATPFTLKRMDSGLREVTEIRWCRFAWPEPVRTELDRKSGGPY